jgi:NhaP-type Na+/H+ or K+/H+ antiporter
MLDIMLVAAGAVAVLVATTLRHLNRYSLSPPMLALVAGIVLGPELLGLASIPPEEEARVMQIAARLLLAIALMSIALRYPISDARKRVSEVAVLVVVVLPVMTVIMAGGAHLLLGVPVALAIAIGAALSPTDPVLASGIVSSQLAEEDIPAKDRQVLSLESAANDGLAMPFVIIGTALVVGRPLPGEFLMAAYEVVAGVAIGVALGWLSGKSIRLARSRREIPAPVRELYTVLVALFVLGVSGVAHADGLLSVFVAGLVHNALVSGRDRRVELGIEESLNQFLVVPVFVLLGLVLPWGEWASLGWSGVAFVAVVLFLRRLPVVVALRRPLGASWDHVLWLGWFGPIGVAAIFYVGHLHEQGVTDPIVWTLGTLIVAVSTVVHGLTAGPARLAYRRRAST